MKVERKEWDGVTILTFTGEWDAFNLPTFSAKIDNLVESGNTNLVFNLRLLTFINSSALGYLVKTKRAVEAGGGDLVASLHDELRASDVRLLSRQAALEY